MKLSKGIQFFAGSTQTTYDLTNLNLSAGNYAITVVAEAEGFTDSDVSNSVNYSVQAQLATPTIAMNADGKTLEITDVANATSYDVYVDGTYKTNIAKAVYGKLQLHGADSHANNQYSPSYSNYFIKLNTAPTNLTTDYDYMCEEYPKDKNGNTLALGTEILVSAGTTFYVWTNGATAYTNSYAYFNKNGGTSVNLTTSAVAYTMSADDIYSFTAQYDTYCLTGDTVITMSDGISKRIDKIKVGDKVLSYNPETGNLEEDEVTYSDSTENKQHDNFDVWIFDDGTIIKTVHRHRFYNIERNAMVYMDEWKIGEHGRRRDGVLVTLVSHENVKETVNHYTIFTKNQNYFANGLLSGNRYTKPIIFGNDGR